MQVLVCGCKDGYSPYSSHCPNPLGDDLQCLRCGFVACSELIEPWMNRQHCKALARQIVGEIITEAPGASNNTRSMG